MLSGSDRDGPHTLAVGFEPGEPKHLSSDGAPVERLTDAPHRPLASVFSPDRLELIKGQPGLRRAHLDQLVAALWPSRAGARREYHEALAQRNALIGRDPRRALQRRRARPLEPDARRGGRGAGRQSRSRERARSRTASRATPPRSASRRRRGRSTARARTRSPPSSSRQSWRRALSTTSRAATRTGSPPRRPRAHPRRA